MIGPPLVKALLANLFPIEVLSRPHPKVVPRKCLKGEALSGRHLRVGSRKWYNVEAFSGYQVADFWTQPWQVFWFRGLYTISIF